MTLVFPSPARRSESGAITIMVSLMLLVLLTVAAIGMSRNSFQEVVNSGFGRQTAMASSMSNSGIDWSIYWMDERNQPGNAVDPVAQNLAQLKTTLTSNPTLWGVAKSVADPTGGTAYSNQGAANVFLAGTANMTVGYTIGVTGMGKWPVTDFSQGNGQGSYNPSSGGILTTAPDLWAIRADAQVVQGSVTFTHGEEAWFTTPVSQ